MDKRKHYLIGLDTETCNGIVIDDKLDLSQSLVYDIGWVITDKYGNIYKTRSYVVYEIFYGMKEQMNSAYYAEKIPQYNIDIKNKKRTLAQFFTIWKQFKEDCKEWNVKAVFAHNASFDLRVLNNTIRYLTKSKYRYFFPYGLEIWDTLKMSRQTIGKRKGYEKFCKTNGYLTKHKKPQLRFTAEVLYKYLSGDYNFSEAHTGLEDVIIETYIMACCYKTHLKMEKRLYPKG